MERWNAYARLGLEVSDSFKPYAQFMYTNYNALQELAPTPAGGSTGFTVPVTNPFITAPLKALLAARPNPTAAFDLAKRFNALGGRTGFNTHDVWQLTSGATGDLVGSWTYDAYASYGRSVLNEIQGGNVRRDRTQALLNAADGGRSLCSGGLNLFGSAEISQACRDYISLEAKNLTVIEQSILEATATGDLADLPAGKLQAAFGASYRELDFDFRPDGGLQPGLVAGFNEQKPVSGVLNFKDAFTEVAVPLLADMPFVKSLSVTLGYRVTENSRSGSDDTYKATFDWTANDVLRFRAGYQHAVRSPNISELFSPQLNNFPTFTNQDPATPPARSRRPTATVRTVRRCARCVPPSRRLRVAPRTCSQPVRLTASLAVTRISPGNRRLVHLGLRAQPADRVAAALLPVGRLLVDRARGGHRVGGCIDDRAALLQPRQCQPDLRSEQLVVQTLRA